MSVKLFINISIEVYDLAIITNKKDFFFKKNKKEKEFNSFFVL